MYPKYILTKKKSIFQKFYIGVTPSLNIWRDEPIL